ncbi:RNA polymerase subunit sigma [Roseateles aquatilis]|uniref:RNA polymerase subunit sigma n=1 Tax=Roseateles aquatilis TaxID=431061 RepID=A0A246IZ99_9BURK|nr:sigma-70 family RNA polymerase sigma factor [Roseateles aquatilis]OWQ85673.1 RNA polymerase subunit sigma [Roseateles aquatilis]
MRSDSSQAFGALYADHHGWLRGVLSKKLGCRHRAEDLTHDTFLKVLANKAMQSLQEPRAFLTTVAHGLVVSLWRRQDLERAYIDALQVQGQTLHGSPEARAEAVQALVEIDELLDGLPPKASRAFLMAQLDGLTYAEIAEELGVSDRMVKKYMAQVMDKLLRRSN